MLILSKTMTHQKSHNVCVYVYWEMCYCQLNSVTEAASTRFKQDKNLKTVLYLIYSDLRVYWKANLAKQSLKAMAWSI